MPKHLTSTVTIGRIEFGGWKLPIQVTPGMLLGDDGHPVNWILDYEYGAIVIAAAGPTLSPQGAVAAAVFNFIVNAFEEHARKLGRGGAAMKFDLHPWMYTVTVCPGPLHKDGEPVLALTYRREILLAGDTDPDGRLEALLDQLRWLRERHHGPLSPEYLPSFVADVLRQLVAQGGEDAVKRLTPIAAGGASCGPVVIRHDGRRMQCPHCDRTYSVDQPNHIWLRRHLLDEHRVDLRERGIQLVGPGEEEPAEPFNAR